ncbi:MAG TPA: APC family permease [Thermoleophilaceae bacterium]|nr:APC family permease [Thermoleophilaceae bacterium]
MEATQADRPTDTPLRRVLTTRLLLIFVIGDVLGAGIYALVGEVGAEVGGAIWTAFTAALLLAVLTAFAYAELVTKYPQAAGSALYVDRGYKIPFLTFMVGFAVMASGITSASTLARAFAGDYFEQFIDLPLLLVALAFILVVAAINLRGIAESVRINVLLTCVEVIGLLLIVAIGVAALGDGDADFSRNFEFKEGESVFLAIIGGASLAFYALIGFEDSVNVAEETRDPVRSFPRALFGGLAIAGVIYLLVTLTASMVVPTGQLSESSGPLLEVVKEGPLDISLKLFAFIALLAVANGALINMIMASRLVYGMARRNIVPAAFGRVLSERRTPHVAIAFTTAIAVVLISTGDISELADTTVLLLLTVFTIVNVTVLVLRRDEVEGEHFRAPAIMPILGALVSLLLIFDTLSDDLEVGLRAGLLLLLGAALWLVNRLVLRREEAT